MYAILKSGGKQYRVKAGDSLKVEKLDQEVGSEININEVLLVGGSETFIGTPMVEKASVTAVISKQARRPKIIVLKKKEDRVTGSYKVTDRTSLSFSLRASLLQTVT